MEKTFLKKKSSKDKQCTLQLFPKLIICFRWMSTFCELQMFKFRAEKLLEKTFKLLKTVAFNVKFLLVVVTSLYDNYLKNRDSSYSRPVGFIADPITVGFLPKMWEMPTQPCNSRISYRFLFFRLLLRLIYSQSSTHLCFLVVSLTSCNNISFICEVIEKTFSQMFLTNKKFDMRIETNIVWYI